MNELRLKEYTTELNKLTSANECLQKHKDCCSKALQTEALGLSTTAAYVVDMSMETIYNRLGMEYYAITDIGAFDNTDTRVEATQNIITSLDSTITKLDKGIQNIKELTKST
jgi:hypothetical protein